jgi:nucleoside-triphosphatase
MAPTRIFLTGEPGCGKTTAVRKISERLSAQGERIGGVISGEIRERGVRVGFNLEDLLTHETGILAHVARPDGPTLGKYRVNLADIERIAVTAIRRATEDASVIFVDELGPMELKSRPFVIAVETALATPKHFVGTIHKRATHHLVTAIKSNPAYEIHELTLKNRNELTESITTKIASRI